MDLYLATSSSGHGGEESWAGRNVLMSFVYARKDPNFGKYLPTAHKFIMDSGAFTFMEAGKQKTREEWIKFTDEYCDFINKYDIKLFFEMDIDSVAGLPLVEELRERIEKRTGKKPIPVWHISRGKQSFIDMCKNYPYVAFGGLMSDGKSRQVLEKAFPWFIATAHHYGAKIHGLGYTSLAGLQKYNFDSVDSSSWSIGARYLQVPEFNNKTGLVKNVSIRRDGQRLSSSTSLLPMGWKVWCEIQDWYRRNR